MDRQDLLNYPQCPSWKEIPLTLYSQPHVHMKDVRTHALNTCYIICQSISPQNQLHIFSFCPHDTCVISNFECEFEKWEPLSGCLVTSYHQSSLQPILPSNLTLLSLLLYKSPSSQILSYKFLFSARLHHGSFIPKPLSHPSNPPLLSLITPMMKSSPFLTLLLLIMVLRLSPQFWIAPSYKIKPIYFKPKPQKLSLLPLLTTFFLNPKSKIHCFHPLSLTPYPPLRTFLSG